MPKRGKRQSSIRESKVIPCRLHSFANTGVTVAETGQRSLSSSRQTGPSRASPTKFRQSGVCLPSSNPAGPISHYAGLRVDGSVGCVLLKLPNDGIRLIGLLASLRCFRFRFATPVLIVKETVYFSGRLVGEGHRIDCTVRAIKNPKKFRTKAITIAAIAFQYGFIAHTSARFHGQNASVEHARHCRLLSSSTHTS